MEGLAGLGDPLLARDRPFNAYASSTPGNAAPSVVDHGLIHSFLRSPYNRRFALTVLGHVAPDDENFQVVWWDRDGSVHYAAPTNWHALTESVTTVWVVPEPEGITEPLAIGVAYGGVWKGSWWPEDWWSNTQFPPSRETRARRQPLCAGFASRFWLLTRTLRWGL